MGWLQAARSLPRARLLGKGHSRFMTLPGISVGKDTSLPPPCPTPGLSASATNHAQGRAPGLHPYPGEGGRDARVLEAAAQTLQT